MNWTWLATIVLVLYVIAAWMMLDQAPSGERVAAIHLTPGHKPLIIGYAELGIRPGAAAAATDHLWLQHRKDGWWIANLSGQRRIDAPTKKYATRYLRRWPLATGDKLAFDNVMVTVLEAAPTQLRLQGPTGVATWNSACGLCKYNSLLQQDPPPFAGCPQEVGMWDWLYGNCGLCIHNSYQREVRLFTIGGQVPCPRRWPLPKVASKGAEVVQRDGKYWLAPGNAEVRFTRAGLNGDVGDAPAPTPPNNWQGFADIKWRLDDPSDPTVKLVLGRTHYRPTWDDSTLTLTPVGGSDNWLSDTIAHRPIPRDSRVRIVWQPIATKGVDLLVWLWHQWPWVLGALGIGMLGALATIDSFITFNHTSPLWLQLLTIVPTLTLGTLTLFSTQTAPMPPIGLLSSLGLAWGLTSMMLALSHRLRGFAGLLWTSAMALILFGALTQGQLGLGGDNSKWLGIATNHWRTLALAGWVILPLTWVSKASLYWLAIMVVDAAAPWWWRWLRTGLPWLAAGVLLLQVGFGSEQGIGDMQPVEGIKTLTALLIAYAGQQLWMRRAGLGQYHILNPIRSVMEISSQVLLFVLFSLLLLGAVRDLSPALLLLLLLVPMLWHLAPHPLGMPSPGANILRGILLAIVLLFISILVWIHVLPEQLPRFVFQYDRLMVWARPTQFAASGYQVLLAQTFAAAGGLTGVADTPWGWNGNIMRLPVIQNDFIGAFVLNRLGSKGGMVILGLQLLYTHALLDLSRAVYNWGVIGDFTRKSAGIFWSLALFASAWLFIAHALIAWGNVLGLLPVMGQPMSFVAAGSSHLLFFALPGLVLGLMVGWLVLDEPTLPSVSMGGVGVSTTS